MELLILMLVCIMLVGIGSLILVVKLDKFINTQELILKEYKDKNLNSSK